MTDRSVLGQLTSFLPGFRPVEGGQLKEMANFLFSTQTGIVASTTSTQAAATPLGAAINIIQTSTGSGTDAVRLTPAIIGAEQWVENRTANTIKVFANGTDRIIPSNSPTPNSSSVGVSVASGELAEFQCGTAGVYKQGNLPGGVAAAPAILVESGSAVKISGMSAAGTLSGTELVDVVQGGVNKRSTAQGIANLAASAPAVLVESGSAVKISNMSAASTLTGAELVDVVQGGGNKKTTTQDIADLGGGISEPIIATQVITSTFVDASVIGAAIVNAGTGGTPGAATVTGTTGIGTKFQATVTIEAGGTIESIDSISVAGSYTVPPTDPANEPVTGGSLTGAVLALGLSFAPSIVGSDIESGLSFYEDGLPGLNVGTTIARMSPNAGTTTSPALEVSAPSDTYLSVVVISPEVGAHGEGLLEVIGYNDNPYVILARYNGVRGAGLKINSGNRIGEINFLGAQNTTDVFYGAKIHVDAAENFDGSHSAASVGITTVDLTEGLADRLVIDGSGNTNIVNGVLAVATPRAIAALPGSPAAGMFATVNDADTPTIGQPVASGGAASAVVCYGGTQWTVISI